MLHPQITSEIAAQALRRVLAERDRPPPGPVTPETRLDELALDSLELVEIFIVIEDLTGFAVATDHLPELTTVADFERIECL